MYVASILLFSACDSWFSPVVPNETNRSSIGAFDNATDPYQLVNFSISLHGVSLTRSDRTEDNDVRINSTGSEKRVHKAVEALASDDFIVESPQHWHVVPTYSMGHPILHDDFIVVTAPKNSTLYQYLVRCERLDGEAHLYKITYSAVLDSTVNTVVDNLSWNCHYSYYLSVSIDSVFIPQDHGLSYSIDIPAPMLERSLSAEYLCSDNTTSVSSDKHQTNHYVYSSLLSTSVRPEASLRLHFDWKAQ